jgi:Protein of unknown function (DUF664)
VEDEKDALLAFLRAQRAGVLAILDGSTPPPSPRRSCPWAGRPSACRAPRLRRAALVPGGPHRFRGPAGLADDDHTPLNTPRPPSAVFAFYRDQCRRSDDIVATTPLSTPALGRHPGPNADEFTDLRRILLHMIEETARHAGHLDIVREMLDGRTGLGPR